MRNLCQVNMFALVLLSLLPSAVWADDSTRNKQVHSPTTTILTQDDKAKPKLSSIQLPGSRWELIEIIFSDGKEIKPKSGEKMTLEFGKNGKVSGKAGINRFTTTYKGKKDISFSLGKIAMTRAANPPGSIADAYIKNLKSAQRYIFNKGLLVLELPYDSGEMTFRRLPDK